MVCIEKIYSVSALVGNGACNAKCDFCAGEYLRPEARESELYNKNFEAAIKLSARYGGWSLSLTSSGEPTCDPDALTKALEIYQKCEQQGAYFPNVNLFTNGILFGDSIFCNKYLDTWKELGLNNIAVSVHAVDEKEQAAIYGVESYPALEKIVDNIEKHGLGVRATLLLRKNGVDDSKTYEAAVKGLIDKRIDNITSWPVGNPDGTRTEDTPSRLGLLGIKMWLHRNAKMCHGHAWGGGVFDYKGNILRITDYVTKHNPRKDFVRQLVVFQDGTVAYSWIKEGALCMK
ncbi:radical SAM protein [Candidatus Woesearchaeota archaeon]|jgi:MoaA/NifB/PqqE/SkfB family radical SAM enzyme|nr:radical SAM protein [Candidatus Woesearchaeota archaeon]MBT5342241.1 radical SAM protein [Candidatus Woesearchaeota archaeon]